MKLNCPACRSPIIAANINLDRMVAKCAECDNVFSFEGQLTPGENAEPGYLKFPVAQPSNIQMTNEGLTLRFTRRWFSPIFFFFAFFTLFWNGITWTFVSVFFFIGEWIPLLFISGHVLVGLGVAYYTLALLLNTTEIVVDHTTLMIRHSPLPVSWQGTKRLGTEAVKQLYCVATPRRRGQHLYDLKAVMEGGQRETLLSGLHNSEEALFLEQEIERFLGIRDQLIPGEYAA